MSYRSEHEEEAFQHALDEEILCNVGFVKRRARRRLRHNEKKQLIEEVVEYEVQSN